LSVCEFVPSALEFIAGEIWSGDGSLMFTGASESAPCTDCRLWEVWKLPLYNSSFRLRRPQRPIRSMLEEHSSPGIEKVAVSKIVVSGAGGKAGRLIRPPRRLRQVNVTSGNSSKVWTRRVIAARIRFDTRVRT